MNTRIIVSAIVQKGNDILLCRKPPDKPPYPNCYHIPGGGVEDQIRALELITAERFDDPYLHEEVQRETMEETGIVVQNILCLCPSTRPTPREGFSKNKNGEDTHYIFLEYLCEYAGGEIVAGDDIAHGYWVPKEQLKELELTPPSIEMFGELHWI